MGTVRRPSLALHVSLVVGLIFAGLLPAPATVRAQSPLDPPPPSREADDWIAPAVAVVMEDAAQAGLDAELAAFEAAREAGPEALLALAERLSPAALDLAMADLVEAREQLADAAPPPPEQPVLDLAQEQAALEAMAEQEVAHRAVALTDFGDPAEGHATDASTAAPLSITAPAVPAANRTVGNSCTYATITAAIAASSPGDTLLIEGGRTFVENVTVPVTLTLQGGYAGCASGSTARTTIDGNALGSVIVVNRAISVTLRNLNVTNGATGFEGGGVQFAWGNGTGRLALYNVFIYGNTGQWGGGLWVGQNAEVIGQAVEISNNTATAYGGGVRLFGSRATFTDSSIYGNSAPLGGGIHATQEDVYVPVVDLVNSDVYGNQAVTGSGLGGGVYLRQGSVLATDCADIYQNEALQGGGAYLITSTLTIQGSCSEISSNSATGNGGGVYAQGSTVNLDEDAELYDNTAGTSGAGNGGGAYLDDSDLLGDKALINYNAADDYGGGVYATHGSLLDMDLGGYACFRARCSRLSNNTSTTLYGGGVYANNSSVDLRNTFVENNTAVLGGGVYASDNAALYAYNSLFARNNATSTKGDAIRLYANASMTGAGNTLAYNDAGGASTGQAIGLYESTLSLHCGIIWSHTSSIDLAGQTVTYSDIQGGYTGTGNLNVDPLFVAPGSSNYHLQDATPLVDRCPVFSGLDTDFDNEARPVVRVSLATPYDMGADETTPPRVGINGAACGYGSIRDAVAVANPGDTLHAMAGTFYENVDAAGKSLTLAGGYAADCVTPGAGTTTVNGLSGSGSVFDISGGTVLLRGLAITGGDAVGGGVDVWGSGTSVTLDNVDVFGNTGAQGGGVWVDTGAVVTATNDSDIYNNTAFADGGGVRVWGRFYGVGNDSDVYDNQAPSGGGFSVPGGHVFLNAADVYGNQATGTLGKGGGMHVSSGGLVTLTNSVFIYFGNTAYDGAGIYADNASVTMTNSTFRDNTATNDGGALYLTNNSVMQATGVSIGQDTTGLNNEAVRGAGIYAITSTVTMIGGRIINNLASSSGGGLYASNSTVNLTGATVGGTGANQANLLGPSGHEGVGLFLTANTRAVLSNTVVSSNTFQSTLYTYGGGAMVDAGSVLTLTNSRVERHLAPDTFDGRGAGLYVRDATVTLDNSQVISNTAGTVGGGVRMYGGKLNVINGSSLINNRTLTGEGGAIAATYDVSTPDINVRGATFGNNAAGTHGGAIYLDAGTLDFSEGWTLRENTAGSNGGAVAIVGTGDARFSAGSYSLAYFNRALGGHGGFIYLANATTAELHATSGYQMYVYANQASGNGGALYADSGGLFDVYGQVNFDRNRADHGGAIYLANASRIWLDDHSEIGPELWDNWADYGSGGAIYASNSPRVECDGATLGRTDDGNHATADGGALFLSGSTLDSDNCLFLYNEAAANGGAIAAYTSTLNLHATYGSPMTIAAGELDVRDGLAPLALAATACDPALGLCSAFFENVANSDGDTTGYGGAIYNNDGMLVVSHTVLYTNTAYYGGAIYQAGTNAHAEVNNTLIYSNTAGVALGAGIRSTGGTFSITHTTLANNINGAGYSQSSTTSEVHNSIAWGNTAGGFWVASGILNGTCSLDQSGNAGPATDPHFVDAAHWDFHLLGDSPAIDACATGLPVDLDNVARPFGAGYDMGAFEWFVRTVFLPLIVRN